MNIQVVGIPWFNSNTYEVTVARFADADGFYPTYSDWPQAAEKLEKDIITKGTRVVRAYLDSDTFSKWLNDNGTTDIDSTVRAEFADLIASQHINT